MIIDDLNLSRTLHSPDKADSPLVIRMNDVGVIYVGACTKTIHSDPRMQFAAQLEHWPAWITRNERGAGFAEMADTLLPARRGRSGQT